MGACSDKGVLQPLLQGVALPSEGGFIHHQVVGLHTQPVSCDLVPCLQLEEIADHDVCVGDEELSAIPHHLDLEFILLRIELAELPVLLIVIARTCSMRDSC